MERVGGEYKGVRQEEEVVSWNALVDGADILAAGKTISTSTS